MRINEVKKNEVNATLNADELVMLHNVMYFYEKHYGVDSENTKPGYKFHDLSAELIVAKDLCQYGGLDSFAVETILKHRLKAYPEEMERLKKIMKKCEDENL